MIWFNYLKQNTNGNKQACSKASHIYIQSSDITTPNNISSQLILEDKAPWLKIPVSLLSDIILIKIKEHTINVEVPICLCYCLVSSYPYLSLSQHDRFQSRPISCNQPLTTFISYIILLKIESLEAFPLPFDKMLASSSSYLILSQIKLSKPGPFCGAEGFATTITTLVVLNIQLLKSRPLCSRQVATSCVTYVVLLYVQRLQLSPIVLSQIQTTRIFDVIAAKTKIQKLTPIPLRQCLTIFISNLTSRKGEPLQMLPPRSFHYIFEPFFYLTSRHCDFQLYVFFVFLLIAFYFFYYIFDSYCIDLRIAIECVPMKGLLAMPITLRSDLESIPNCHSPHVVPHQYQIYTYHHNIFPYHHIIIFAISMQADNPSLFPIHPLSSITTLYSTDNSPRYQSLVTSFTQVYGDSPQFIARAPGRFNLIGQHIDYEGYGVLPAAIEKDTLIAVKKTQNKTVMVAHVNPDKYPSQTFMSDPQATTQFKNDYLKYFRAGYKAGIKNIPTSQLTGMMVMISGNVPLASGLSSSSALCVCSALAAHHANFSSFKSKNNNNIQCDRQQFVQNVIVGQRQTGTASGGMDQSISVLGKLNSCLYIQFNPIRCTPVQLPADARFVVMNSLVDSPKLTTAVFRYNKRVCQCRIAAKMLSVRLGIPGQAKILKVVESWSGLTLDILHRLVSTFITCQPYTQQQLQAIIDQPLQQVLSDIPLHAQVLKANKTYRIWQAATHVFKQAYRVIEYIRICSSQLKEEDQLVLLGKLMDESQWSAKQLYECSCPQIDEICEMAVKKGAYGSRLTGAGWGGCTVTLVHKDRAEGFIKEMIEDYYMKKPQLKSKIQEIGIENVVFESKPSEGACIVTL